MPRKPLAPAPESESESVQPRPLPLAPTANTPRKAPVDAAPIDAATVAAVAVLALETAFATSTANTIDPGDDPHERIRRMTRAMLSEPAAIALASAVAAAGRADLLPPLARRLASMVERASKEPSPLDGGAPSREPQGAGLFGLLVALVESHIELAARVAELEAHAIKQPSARLATEREIERAVDRESRSKRVRRLLRSLRRVVGRARMGEVLGSLLD